MDVISNECRLCLLVCYHPLSFLGTANVLHPPGLLLTRMLSLQLIKCVSTSPPFVRLGTHDGILSERALLDC